MTYRCQYKPCIHGNSLQEQLIVSGEEVCCSKCGNKNRFHKDCFVKHNHEKHNGKAILQPCGASLDNFKPHLLIHKY